MSTEPPTEVPVEEEKMLCPCCFYQNIPEVAFCKDCGAPLGCFIGLDPMQHIYAEGFAYRRATGGSPSWIVEFPIFAYSMMALGAWFRQHRPNPVDLFLVLLFGLYAGTFLYQATVNYVRKAKLMKPEPPAEEVTSVP